MGYSTALGRFISRDPVGYVDGMNPYQAVRSSPVNLPGCCDCAKAL